MVKSCIYMKKVTDNLKGECSPRNASRKIAALGAVQHLFRIHGLKEPDRNASPGDYGNLLKGYYPYLFQGGRWKVGVLSQLDRFESDIEMMYWVDRLESTAEHHLTTVGNNLPAKEAEKIIRTQHNLDKPAPKTTRNVGVNLIKMVNRFMEENNVTKDEMRFMLQQVVNLL